VHVEHQRFPRAISQKILPFLSSSKTATAVETRCLGSTWVRCLHGYGRKWVSGDAWGTGGCWSPLFQTRYFNRNSGSLVVPCFFIAGIGILYFPTLVHTPEKRESVYFRCRPGPKRWASDRILRRANGSSITILDWPQSFNPSPCAQARKEHHPPFGLLGDKTYLTTYSLYYTLRALNEHSAAPISTHAGQPRQVWTLRYNNRCARYAPNHWRLAIKTKSGWT